MNNLKKKKYITMLAILVLLLFLSGLYIFHKKLESQYKEIPPRDLTAKDPKELMIKLLEGEEYFRGSIGYKFLDLDKNWIEIELTNTSIGDDSTTGKNELIYANKNGEQWVVISQKIRFKCRGIFFKPWTTQSCG